MTEVGFWDNDNSQAGFNEAAMSDMSDMQDILLN